MSTNVPEGSGTAREGEVGEAGEAAAMAVRIGMSWTAIAGRRDALLEWEVGGGPASAPADPEADWDPAGSSPTSRRWFATGSVRSSASWRAGGRPASIGRTADDPVRVLTVERDRAVPVRELLDRTGMESGASRRATPIPRRRGPRDGGSPSGAGRDAGCPRWSRSTPREAPRGPCAPARRKGPRRPGMTIEPRAALAAISPYCGKAPPNVPGALKPASNENPLGPSPRALEAITAALPEGQPVPRAGIPGRAQGTPCPCGTASHQTTSWSATEATS